MNDLASDTGQNNIPEVNEEPSCVQQNDDPLNGLPGAAADLGGHEEDGKASRMPRHGGSQEESFSPSLFTKRLNL